jgi:MFS family permease
VLGKWQLRVGPRMSLVVAGACFGGGLMLGALGISMHSLPLLYLGYGVLGGTALGLAYTPPVQALFAWFPDKRGLASGLTIAGFGSGALIFTPAIHRLMTAFSQSPSFVGPVESTITQSIDGKLFAQTVRSRASRKAAS